MYQHNKHKTEIAKLLDTNFNQVDQGSTKLEELNSRANQIYQEQNEISEDLQDTLDFLNDFTESMKNDSFKINEDIQECVLSFDSVWSTDTEKVSNKIDTLSILEGTSLQESLVNNLKFREEHNFSDENIYYAGLSQSEINSMNKLLVDKYDLSKLEKFDYAMAASIGAIMSLVDILFVGRVTTGKKVPQSVLSKWTDKQFDNLVKGYAWLDGWNPKKDGSPFTYLEREHKVSYDSATTLHLKEEWKEGKLTPGNHHLVSVAHSPSLIGLIFGVLDQLNGGVSLFNADGSITFVKSTNVNNDLSENTIKKIVESIVNWFGHTMSDISGNSGSKYRGAGLPPTFITLSQKINIGSFTINGKEGMTVANVTGWLFEQGLDVRMLTTQSIPVIVGETLIRLYWMCKQHFYYDKPWKESVPIANNKDLQKLILVQCSVFSVGDVADSLLKSTAGWHNFLLNVNYIGLCDLGFRSMQVMRSTMKHNNKISQLDKDLQEERERILAEV
ncbi:hypothetical protein [Weissella viridescens]|uniref:hypothetical protein n=1 Tax=Weissella viridescens TaxID=1629 RepID=UPI0040561E33